MFNRIAPLSKTAAVRLCGVVLTVLVASTAVAAQAQDARVRQGVSASAPAGFLDYCRRAPEQCRDADAPATGDEDARIRARATAMYWDTAFAVTDHGVRGGERVADLQGDQALSARRQGLAAAARAPATAPDEAFSIEDAATDAVGTQAEPITLSKARWDSVEAVNRGVNRKIRRSSDQNAHGQADYWEEVTKDGSAGDCEDYVLTKRHALIDAGVPVAALSIAIVETPWGETHAVLIVAADDGDYVMDNLSPWVKRWSDTGYRFVERQTPGRPLEWVSAR